MSRRVLIVAYQFPPVGGAGVQRVSKLTKFLPQHGWSCSVLTTQNPSVPTTDSSLAAEVPEETVIRRALTWEPGYRFKKQVTQPAGSTHGSRLWRRTARRLALNALQPDPQVLWVPPAIREGRRLLQEVQHDAIIVSGPPFSSFLVGRKLAREFGLPLVLDFRDEWGLSSRFWENRADNSWTRCVQQRLQSMLLRASDALVATTSLSADHLRGESDRLRHAPRVECIYNGFDPDDFQLTNGAPEHQPGFVYDLTHVGTLWTLTSASPTLRAIAALSANSPELARSMSLRLIGRAVDVEEAGLQQTQSMVGRLDRVQYIRHSDAVRTMCQSSELGLFLSDVAGAERVLPGKTFEYLASRRPILTVAAEGELTQLVRRFAGVTVIAPDRTEDIMRHFLQAIRRAEPLPDIDRSRQLEPFNRRHQAGQFAELLERVSLERQTSSAA